MMVDLMPFGGAMGRAFVWSQRGNLMLTVHVRARVNLVSEGAATVTTCGPIPQEEEWTPVLMKPEVVVRATAYPAAATTAMSVRLFIGRDSGPVLDKTLHVYGDRSARGAPTPFRAMPITYERALGGPGSDNPTGRNPAQTGSSPNIVDPTNNWMIAGFAPIDERWPSRQRLRGPMPPRRDGALLVLPDGLDLAFFQTAPSDQRVSRLEGDEWLVLDGLHPSLPRFRTQLPGLAASARITNPRQIAGPIEIKLDRLSIDMNGLFAELDYRGTMSLAALPAGLAVVAGVASLDDLDPEPTVTKPRPIELPKPDLGTTWTNVREPAQPGPALPFHAVRAEPEEESETTVTSLDELRALAGGALPFPMPPTEPRPNIPAGGAALPFKQPKPSSKPAIPAISVPRVSDESDDQEFTASIHLGALVRSALPFGAKAGASVNLPAVPKDLSKTAPPFIPDAPLVPADPSVPAAVPAPAAASRPVPPAAPAIASPPAIVVPSAVAVPPIAVPSAVAPTTQGTSPTVLGSRPLGASPPFAVPPAHEPAVADDASVTTDTEPAQEPAATPRLLFPTAPEAAPVEAPKAIDLAQFEVEHAPAASPAAPVTPSEKDPARRRVLDAIRDGVPVRSLDLAGVDLGGMDLTGQDLRDLPLSSAKLVRAILVDARLSGAKLQGADLTGADLTRADLSGADISRANLTEAKLVGATLDQINAMGARFERAVLTDAKAVHANFVTANLGDARAERLSARNADLSGAQLVRANLSGASLVNAKLSEVRADEAKFSHADLSDASCGGASFVDADFRDAQIARAQLDRTDLTRANFDRVKGGQTKFARARLGLASFVGAQLEKSDFSGTTGEGAEFSESNVSGSDFRTAKLPDLRMQKAKLVEVQAQKLVAPAARFEGADLTSASLRGARLKEVDLAGADVTGADFRDADLENARADAVDLKKAKTNGANMRGLK